MPAPPSPGNSGRGSRPASSTAGRCSRPNGGHRREGLNRSPFTVLHGLEDLVRRRFPGRTVKGERFNPATLIRYADDFVVLHAEEGVVREAQEVIAEWLRHMGLELKASKTRIGHTLHEVVGRAGFDFLGFTVRQFPA